MAILTNNIKYMKKFLFGFIATVALSGSIHAQNITDMDKDPNFRSYVNNEINFVEQSNPALIKALPKTLKQSDLPQVYAAFNTTQAGLISFINQQNAKLRILIPQYNLSSASEQTIGIEVGQVLVNYGTMGSSNCGRIYRDALVFNLSMAVMGHVACGAADVTVVLGLLCHAAVLTAQAAANDSALAAYEDCMGN
jgi:hypothetical protein